MKILFVGFKYLHHSYFGGYDWISNYPGADYFDITKIPFIGSRFMCKRGGRFVPSLGAFIALLKSRSYDVVHFFYADRCLAINKNLSTAFVATTHLRSENYDNKYLTTLKKCSCVITLSSDEAYKLKSIGINAIFIPHGFNIPSFQQELTAGFDCTKINIFYAGSNYRDGETFLSITEYMKSECPNMIFHAVGQNKTWKEKLKGKSNIIVYEHLSDNEYYTLLCNCDYNFLPLTFATANNALLEAQSLGVVSILPKISGITDYACEKENLFYSGFSDLTALFQKLNKRTSCSLLKDYSKKFEWKNIYSELSKLYEGLKK